MMNTYTKNDIITEIINKKTICQYNYELIDSQFRFYFDKITFGRVNRRIKKTKTIW